MNERIRELYRQSHTDGFFGMAFDPEKFAELIVNECIGVVENGYFLHNESPEAKFSRDVSAAIKRHFGVE